MVLVDTIVQLPGRHEVDVMSPEAPATKHASPGLIEAILEGKSQISTEL